MKRSNLMRKKTNLILMSFLLTGERKSLARSKFRDNVSCTREALDLMVLFLD